MHPVDQPQVVQTDSHTSCSTLITEPVSGNIIIGGFRDGKVKLYDLRHNHILPVLTWQGDASPGGQVASGRAIAKAGVVYGESTQVTSAWFVAFPTQAEIRQLLTRCTSARMA
jgi:regulator-associated protein of mTOR